MDKCPQLKYKRFDHLCNTPFYIIWYIKNYKMFTVNPEMFFNHLKNNNEYNCPQYVSILIEMFFFKIWMQFWLQVDIENIKDFIVHYRTLYKKDLQITNYYKGIAWAFTVSSSWIIFSLFLSNVDIYIIITFL